MDIEKLIEQLNGYFEGEKLRRGAALDAATALSTLQEENEKLRAELENYRKGHCSEGGCAAEKDRDAVLAELEQVKRERDAAVSDLTFVVNQYRLETTGIDLCGLCEYDLPPVGENGQTAECPGFYVDDCFKWRGPEEG